MSKFTEVDLWFTDDGDLAVGSNGDLFDTQNNFGRAILQEVRDRLRSQKGEWKLNESIGSSLLGFLGEAGTEANIEQVANEIERSLTFDRMLLPGEVEIIPLQLNQNIAFFRIIVKTRDGELSTSIGYDSNRQRFIGY